MTDAETKARAFDEAMAEFRKTSKHQHKQSRIAAGYGIIVLKNALRRVKKMKGEE